MVELIDHIDEQIHECLGDGKYYGLCRLLTDDQAIYPATYANSAGKYTKVYPDDKYKILTYHRLLDGAPTANPDLSFGRTLSMENRQRVRMVVLIDFSEGETIIDSIINAIPDQITQTDLDSVDYKSVTIDPSMSLIRDRANIWSTEWGTAYADKYQLRYNVYALEYSINYIRCNDCVTS